MTAIAQFYGEAGMDLRYDVRNGPADNNSSNYEQDGRWYGTGTLTTGSSQNAQEIATWINSNNNSGSENRATVEGKNVIIKGLQNGS